MTKDDELSDDFVANILKQDAKTQSARYAEVGLSAWLPTRPVGQAPKPNTRFLKNILRETTTHNAALLAKEEADTRNRLKALTRNGRSLSESSGRARIDETHHERDRDSQSKRSKLDTEDKDRSRKSRSYRSRRYDDSEEDAGHSYRRQHRHRESRYDREYRQSEKGEVEQRSRRRSRSIDTGDRKDGRSRHKHQHTSGRRRSRSRSRSPMREDRQRRHHRHRAHSSRRSRSHSPRRREPRKRTSQSPHRPSAETGSLKRERAPEYDSNDSDPLEAIVGPAPPPLPPKVRPRGRGKISAGSAMDSHFAADYDPSADIDPDPVEEDDWDQALEAMKDRMRWRQQGADRLRAAGFTDEEVNKWETGGEKTEDDVQWAKKGEGREWDRGKVVHDDFVDTRPEWGRLKGT